MKTTSGFFPLRNPEVSFEQVLGDNTRPVVLLATEPGMPADRWRETEAAKATRGDQHCQNNEVINKWIALLKNKTKKHAHIHLQKSISMNESSFSRLASVSPCYYHPVLSHQPFVLQILSWATFVTSPVSSSLLVVNKNQDTSSRNKHLLKVTAASFSIGSTSDQDALDKCRMDGTLLSSPNNIISYECTFFFNNKKT